MPAGPSAAAIRVAGDGSAAGRAARGRAASLSRRHDRGAKTARGLLFTVLGEFVLPAGGVAWTAAFIEVLGRLGVEEKAARQALMRTAADGWLTSDRVGRRTRWLLTPSAEQLLTEGAERIYSFSAARKDWDGHWLLVLARAPEADRPARHLLRTRLSWAGFGSPAPGVWLSPDTGRKAEAERALADAGLLTESQIFLAEHSGGGELAAMTRQAWDLEEIERRYEGFLAQFASAVAADSLTMLIELVHAWRRFPWIDPVLPAAMLPDGWSGSRAAELFKLRHSNWAATAGEMWQNAGSLASSDVPQ
jgi:phenylacetic acid degradation operon negative regulatory protein